jgi:hypothetical protein
VRIVFVGVELKVRTQDSLSRSRLVESSMRSYWLMCNYSNYLAITSRNCA